MNGSNCSTITTPNTCTVVKEEKKDIINTTGTVTESVQQTPPSSTPPTELLQVKKEENDTHEVCNMIRSLCYLRKLIVICLTGFIHHIFWLYP